MGVYPVSLVTFRERVARAPYLGRLEDTELTAALATARGDVELYAPAVADGDLTDRIDRIAGALHADLAWYYVRYDNERDEEGSPPKALETMYSRLMDRLDALQKQAEAQPATSYAVEAFAALAPPPLPDGRTDRGETAESDW